jgi:hypothetical protein
MKLEPGFEHAHSDMASTAAVTMRVAVVTMKVISVPSDSESKLRVLNGDFVAMIVNQMR